ALGGIDIPYRVSLVTLSSRRRSSAQQTSDFAGNLYVTDVTSVAGLAVEKPQLARLNVKTLVAAYFDNRKAVRRSHLAQHAVHMIFYGLFGEIQAASHFLV